MAQGTKQGKLLLSKELELNSLLEVTQAINNNLPAESLFRIYEFIMRGQMKIEKLAFFVSNKTISNNELSWECACYFGVEDDIKGLDVSKVLLKYKENTVATKASNKLIKQFEEIIPVFHKDQPLAYTLISTSEMDFVEEREDRIRFIQTISNIIMVAIENKKLFLRQLEQEGMKRELELAAKMQTMLIPSELPKNEFFEFAAVYLPNHEVGGDYYDFIRLSEEEHIFCIADISGKGVAAALLMANFQATLRAMVKQKLSSEKFIKILNKNVAKITGGDKFITMFIAKYNVKSRQLIYVNAGHNPPLLFAKNNITQLETGTTILGMFNQLPFLTIGEAILEKNSLLVNYTDGMTDLENEEEDRFEVDRLKEFVQKNATLNIEKFNKKLIDYLEDFKGSKLFVDDITLLTCRFY